ncbi:MAG: HAD hydrolase family protein [Lachnospiraceae bacterium]|nr:HAD hydrolase family protein [Lachnospiraceae bacterium]MBR1853663.1 HAD hydrolase family protein [Lachnospiraceae bacterium]
MDISVNSAQIDDWKEDSLKVCVRIVDENKARQIQQSLPNCDSIRFTDEYWYKFTKKNVTKENAIIKMCEILEISLMDVTAFGDDLADIGMLKLCGLSVAMGNALDEVKAVADITIGTNDEDGIAEYIKNLIMEFGGSYR